MKNGTHSRPRTLSAAPVSRRDLGTNEGPFVLMSKPCWLREDKARIEGERLEERKKSCYKNTLYYMASFVSEQDEPYPALWLVTRAGKMELSCPLRSTRCIPRENFSESHIINPLLTKLVWSRWCQYWPRSFFCEFMDRDSVSVAKMNLANIQPS